MSHRALYGIASACFAFATVMWVIDDEWGLAATTFGLAAAFVGLASSSKV